MHDLHLLGSEVRQAVAEQLLVVRRVVAEVDGVLRRSKIVSGQRARLGTRNQKGTYREPACESSEARGRAGDGRFWRARMDRTMQGRAGEGCEKWSAGFSVAEADAGNEEGQE